MIDAFLAGLADSAWALPAMLALVWADALLVVVPGEIAVTVLGALAVEQGSPPLWGVVTVAALGAVAGDATSFALGRAVGLDRWRWMRHRRIRQAFAWAHDKLERRIATAVFTARFIPFARLAVNLTAGATRVSAPRFFAAAGIAACAWACYQALIGAAVGAIVPGGPVVAVLIAIGAAVALGTLIDLIIGRFAKPVPAEPRANGE